MALITWMNVPIPDVGGTRQAGIRTAADLFSRATASAGAGVAQVQAIQDAEQQAQVRAADRFVLEKMLSTDDPAKYNQMRADGSLLGPAADKASNATLQAAELRGTQLYAQDRERNRNRELQAAEKVWDKAVPFATDDPAKFQDIMRTASFSDATDAAAFAKRGRELYVDPESGRVASERAKKEELTRASADLADRVIGLGRNPERASVLLMGEQDPLVRQGALDILTKRGETVSDYYSSAPTPTASTKGITDGAENAMFKHFGGNLAMGIKAAGPGRPPPGSQEWAAQNGDRVPTQADVVDWSEAYVKPGSEAQRGKGRGTTAIGPAQIVNTTRRDIIERFGKQMFGTDDLRRIPYTLENEEKIAEKVYQTQKAGAWEATQSYAGLKDLSAFKGKSWDDAKPLLYYIDGGVAPASFQGQVKQLEAKLQERELGLSEGAKVILNAREKKDYGLNEAAVDVAKALGKDTLPGEVRSVIDQVVRTAKEAGSPVTHAEAAGLVLNAVRDDSSWTVSDLSKDLDLEEGKLMQKAKDLGNARADLKSYEKNAEAVKRVQELSAKYKTDSEAALKQLSLARRSAGAGEAAIVAFRQLQNTSDQIAKLVAPPTRSAVSKSLIEGARPAPVPEYEQVSREPDVNLMLSPQQSSSPERPLSSSSFMAR